jgi:hypothetical protein
VSIGSLAGSIYYRIRGPKAAVDVVSDFGDGERYPVTSWRCP